MAASKVTPSFDDIIQADRQRKKNEALAQQIFGQGRRSSTPLLSAKRRPGTGPSLASRVGITKPLQRSSSSTPRLRANIDSTWGHDRHHLNNIRSPRLVGNTRELTGTPRSKPDLFGDVSVPRSRSNPLLQDAPRAFGRGMIIRGLAGPYVVVGSNFAPGTTAADIQSAMEPVGGEVQSCKIVASSPTVIAEMTFTDKGGAENVIATFNNQKADGRILYVYMKQGTASPVRHATIPAEKLVLAPPTEPRAARVGLARKEVSYDDPREPSGRTDRRAEPEYQDGSYGFDVREERMDVDIEQKPERREEDRRSTRHRNEDVLGLGNGQARDSDRGSDGRGLYSDSLYPRRGRGFR